MHASFFNLYKYTYYHSPLLCSIFSVTLVQWVHIVREMIFVFFFLSASFLEVYDPLILSFCHLYFALFFQAS